MNETEFHFRKNLGKAIVLRRVLLDISRRELGTAAGISYPYISEIEKGQKAPALKTMDRIAEALDMTASQLFYIAEQIPAMTREAGSTSLIELIS